ncbi:MAG: hypothetical protein UDD86_02265, partial [Sodaliphilus sp.]|nr:hypothetical protein [Sodaliphilus sp.]
MYKNPIFGDIIPQKNHQFILQYNIFQNSLKYSKYASISPTIFLQKIHPLLPVSPSSCYGSVENYWEIDCALLPNREWNQKQKPKKQHQISQKRFCMVGTRYFESTENIRVFGGFLRARGVFLEKMTAIEAFSRFLGKRFFVWKLFELGA